MELMGNYDIPQNLDLIFKATTLKSRRGGQGTRSAPTAHGLGFVPDPRRRRGVYGVGFWFRVLRVWIVPANTPQQQGLLDPSPC